MNSDLTDDTEAALEKIRSVSDSGSHMKVAGIRTEKFRFYAICAVQSHESHMSKTTFICSG